MQSIFYKNYNCTQTTPALISVVTKPRNSVKNYEALETTKQGSDIQNWLVAKLWLVLSAFGATRVFIVAQQV